jgi:hypothetical protein
LEEFSHLMLYDNIPEEELADAEAKANGGGGMTNGHHPSPSDLALRERELALRQREIALREQEYAMRRGRRPPPSAVFDEDDDEDDYFDPAPRTPAQPMIDPDNFDMMSVTSRRTRKAPSASQLRKNPELRSSQMPGGRPPINRNRVSARLMQDIPGLNDPLMDNPLMGFSSNRYGAVDRKVIADESRTNSLTAARLEELQHSGVNGGPYAAAAVNRRVSQSPANPYGAAGGPMSGPGPRSASVAGMHRPPPMGGGYGGGGPNGVPGAGYGPPPPPPAEGGVRQPIPQYPAGQGNQVAPQQVEQRAGVSHLRPPKGSSTKMRSLTGSASASAESGDSGTSLNIDSEKSASSSQSSLGPGIPARATVGVRG